MRILDDGCRAESSRAVVRPITPAPRIMNVGLDILIFVPSKSSGLG